MLESFKTEENPEVVEWVTKATPAFRKAISFLNEKILSHESVTLYSPQISELRNLLESAYRDCFEIGADPAAYRLAIVLDVLGGKSGSER